MAERCWIVGSAPDCDIRVENSVVSGRHCRLTLRGESFLVEDLASTNGTFVASERIVGPRIVRRGEPVTLGRNVSLPWPPVVRSVTIGRLPENDIVIPLDMISGQHAQLEQEGDTVYLIDAGSTNGTAVNDPLNRITRTAIHPTDQVYFGTHRVAARELIKALPKQAERATTVLESGGPAGLERELGSSVGRGPQRDHENGQSAWGKFRSRSSWMWGLGLSALCAVVILGAPMVLRSRTQTEAEVGSSSGEKNTNPSPRPDEIQSPRGTDRPTILDQSGAKPSAKDERGKGGEEKTESAAQSPPTLPSAVKPPDEAVVLIGVRIDKGMVIDSVSAWACRPDAVICPTAHLEILERDAKAFKDLNPSLVVCTPRKTLAILHHTAGHGPAEGFSLAKLEAPLDATCTVAGSNVRLVPDQHLKIIAARCETKDDPQSIIRKPYAIQIERIERAEQLPTMLHCHGEKADVNLHGAPVFDETGSVVGCVKPSDEGVDVLPVARLGNLLMGNP